MQNHEGDDDQPSGFLVSLVWKIKYKIKVTKSSVAASPTRETRYTHRR
jgi:hypothetical protein